MPAPPSRDAADRPWYTRRLVFGLVAVGILGVALALFLTLDVVRGVIPGTGGSPRPTPRTEFSFKKAKVSTVTYTGKPAPKAGRKAAESIRSVLSRFYDAAFMDPATWASGPGDDVWRFFAPSAVGRAKKNARALTIGRVQGMEALEVRRATLSVKVLLGPSLVPQAALATVVLVADGSLEDGAEVDVRNQATLLLRRVSGKWRIVGYPSARTTVDGSSGSPSGPGPPVPPRGGG